MAQSCAPLVRIHASSKVCVVIYSTKKMQRAKDTTGQHEGGRRGWPCRVRKEIEGVNALAVHSALALLRSTKPLSLVPLSVSASAPRDYFEKDNLPNSATDEKEHAHRSCNEGSGRRER